MTSSNQPFFFALCTSLPFGCADKGSGGLRRQPQAPPTTSPQAAGVEQPVAPVNVRPKVTFPDVPGWEREPEKALGEEPVIVHGYNSETSAGRIAVTIYVSTRGHATVPNGPSSEVVRQELENALSALRELVDRGQTYRSVELKARDTAAIGISTGAPLAQRAVLDVVHADGLRALSVIMTTGAKNHVVKIRVTQPGHDSAAEGRALAPLMNAVAQALRER